MTSSASRGTGSCPRRPAGRPVVSARHRPPHGTPHQLQPGTPDSRPSRSSAQHRRCTAPTSAACTQTRHQRPCGSVRPSSPARAAAAVPPSRLSSRRAPDATSARSLRGLPPVPHTHRVNGAMGQPELYTLAVRRCAGTPRRGATPNTPHSHAAGVLLVRDRARFRPARLEAHRVPIKQAKRATPHQLSDPAQVQTAFLTIARDLAQLARRRIARRAREPESVGFRDSRKHDCR